jgi:hypothetical protein
MLVGYARVSAQEQDLAPQLDALEAAGCGRVFEEKASGAQRERPALRAALGYMRRGDTLVVWKLDRLARSLKQLVETVEDLGARGVGLRSLTEARRSTPPPPAAGSCSGRWWDRARRTWRDGRGRRVPSPALAEDAPIRTTRVVLAAAHLDHDPAHCGRRHRNVRALCQRCHLLHDRPEHRRRIRLTLRRRRALGDLFAGPYPSL